MYFQLYKLLTFELIKHRRGVTLVTEHKLYRSSVGAIRKIMNLELRMREHNFQFYDPKTEG